MKPHLTTPGYWGFLFRRFGKQTNVTIHRLLATCFIDNPEKKSEVNHIDGIKEHFDLPNLEWATSSENKYHALRTGLKKIQRGEEASNSRHTEKEVRDIYELAKSGMFTQKEIYEAYGLSRHGLYGITSKRRWAHIHTTP